MNEGIQPLNSSPHNQENVVKAVHQHQVQTEKPKEILEKHAQQAQVNVSEKVINETVQEKPLAEETKTKQAQQTVEDKAISKVQQISGNKQESALIQEVQQLPVVRADAQKKHEKVDVAAPQLMEGNIKQQQEKPHTSQQKADLNVDINPLSSIIIFKPQENQGQEQVVLPAQIQQIKTEANQKVRQIQRPLDAQNTHEGQESKNAQDGLQEINRNIHYAELVQTVEHKEDESIQHHQEIVLEHLIQSNPQEVFAKQPSKAGNMDQQQPEGVTPQQNQIKITEEPTILAEQPPKYKENIQLKHQNALQIRNEAVIQPIFQQKPQQFPLESKIVQKLNDNVGNHKEKLQLSEDQKGHVVQPRQQQKIDIIHSQDTKQKAIISATRNQQTAFVEEGDISHPQNKQIVQKPLQETVSDHEQTPTDAAVIIHAQAQQPLLHNKDPIQLKQKSKVLQIEQAHQQQAKSQQKEVQQNHLKQATALQNVTPPAHKQAVDSELTEHLEVKQVMQLRQQTCSKGHNEDKGQINEQQTKKQEGNLNKVADTYEEPNFDVKQQKMQYIPNQIESNTNQHIEKKGAIQAEQHQIKIESTLNEVQYLEPKITDEIPVQKQPSSPNLIEKQQAVVIQHQKDAEQQTPEVHLASNECITVEQKEIQQHYEKRIEQAKEQINHQHPPVQKQAQRLQMPEKLLHNQHISSKNNDQAYLPHKDQSVKEQSHCESSRIVTQKGQQGRQHIQINIIKIESDQELQNQNEVAFKEQKIEYIPENPSEKEQKVVQDVEEPEQKHEQTGQHHLNQVNKSYHQQVQHINAIQPTQNVQQISSIPKNHHEERVRSGLPQSIAQEKSNFTNGNQVQKPQPTLQHTIFQQPHVNDAQVEQRQVYKFNTQNMETIQEQKPKDKQVVEFIEFHQQQKIKSQPQPLPTHKQQPKQHVSQQPATKQHHQNIDFKISNKPPVQKASTLNTIDIIRQQISHQKPPSFKQTIINKDGIGKIARRIVGEKRVNDVIEEIRKYDQKEPKKQPRPTSRRRKIDASKVEHISLKSNIISVTVGQILSKEDHVQADKLLDQIDQLKKKLFQLEKRKELAQMQTIQKAQAAQKDTIMTNKSHKKILTGKIYRRADSNNSRVTEEVQTQGYATQKNNSIAVSSAPRQRFSSTQDFSAPKTASKQFQIDNKTGPVIFRVKKNNKTMHGAFDFNLNEKEPLFVKSKEFQTQEKGFQARRQDYERLEFQQQEKLHPLEKPSPRKLAFDENFKEQIEKYFIQLDNEGPKRDWDQEQLVQTARQTYKKFGINIQTEKHLTLSVKKYKNCVSFILDNNRTILWYYQGKFYFGGWKINRSGQGEKSGWGYDYSPGKYIFSGSFVENKRDGYGVIKLLTRQNDTIYEGGWKNGFKHGHGKQREVDETQYIGEWAQGKKNGKGKIKGQNGQYFDGTFLSGVKNGEGAQKFKNGDSYEGNYYDGKFHGMGVYIWANLSKYQGQFKEGSRNGNGIWVSNHTTEHTDRYEGQYKNDRKSGFGVYRWKDGTAYQGQFLNDLKHGEGIVSYGDGKPTKLQWYEGNVVSKHSGDKQKISKRSISKSSSKKGEEKGYQTKSPLIKFNIGNESKLKPTRLSFGMEQF